MTDQNSLSDAARLSSSFTEFLRADRPDLLPSLRADVTHIEGTTILALRYRDGVLMAGDRRATAGMSIAMRDIEKVFPTDSHSAVAISGAPGPAIEIVRLFQTELEYYEKVEGEALSLAGKANHLGRMIRGNFPAALQGLVVVPLFAGYDTRSGQGRIYSYDVTGGAYKEPDYHATGSGGPHAKNTLKKLYTRAQDVDAEAALRLAVEALADAAEEDAATAGPDPVHRIYPTVFAITAAGVDEVGTDDVERVSRAVLADRTAASQERGAE
jgi:proteasome beta subunit